MSAVAILRPYSELPFLSANASLFPPNSSPYSFLLPLSFIFQLFTTHLPNPLIGLLTRKTLRSSVRKEISKPDSARLLK
ncbi:hypothetical protein ACTXT7_009710 [Hymenolepis weldensis]